MSWSACAGSEMVDEAFIPSVSEREPGLTGDALGASAGLHEQGETLCSSVQGTTRDHCWEMVGSHQCALKTVGFNVCKEM